MPSATRSYDNFTKRNLGIEPVHGSLYTRSIADRTKRSKTK